MKSLTNCRILVVEDEFLIAAALCDMIEDASAIVVGPAHTLSDAMLLVQNREIDAAILDINLNGQLSFPVADLLRASGKPFIFTTGYGASDQTLQAGARVLPKPYTWEEVEEQLTKAVMETGEMRTTQELP